MHEDKEFTGVSNDLDSLLQNSDVNSSLELNREVKNTVSATKLNQWHESKD